MSRHQARDTGFLDRLGFDDDLVIGSVVALAFRLTCSTVELADLGLVVFDCWGDGFSTVDVGFVFLATFDAFGLGLLVLDRDVVAAPRASRASRRSRLLR